jgi:hypothetical protein
VNRCFRRLFGVDARLRVGRSEKQIGAALVSGIFGFFSRLGHNRGSGVGEGGFIDLLGTIEGPRSRWEIPIPSVGRTLCLIVREFKEADEIRTFHDLVFEEPPKESFETISGKVVACNRRHPPTGSVGDEMIE